MLTLSAICHFTRILLFIASTPPGSSTEHMFTVKDELQMATAQVRYSITQNIERVCACFQEKCYKVCIARAAVNQSVCEDSHTEQM